MRDSQLWQNHAYAPIPRACIVGGCPHLAVPGRSRCRHHGPKAPARQGPNPYGYVHQKLREEATNSLPMICGVCHHPILPGQRRHLDHIRPLSLGGTATIDNVQWAHEGCNISKGGRNRKRKQ